MPDLSPQISSPDLQQVVVSAFQLDLVVALISLTGLGGGGETRFSSVGPTSCCLSLASGLSPAPNFLVAFIPVFPLSLYLVFFGIVDV